MILYMENCKDYNKKLLEFSKVARYRRGMQKSLAFLYTNNKRSKREIRKSITFTIV